ncbi:MAG TPA: class I SAM-dependent methyltransferase [Gemmatimonadales bacterium]|nr:class I SAM-dependent methyltransferase [Gemmatimonadales bacterium]
MQRDESDHWQEVYDTKAPAQVSWYQLVPEQSLEYIRRTGMPRTTPVLDVGGGASTLVDHLLREGWTDVTVLDIAPGGLGAARARLGAEAERVTWIVADITAFSPARRFGIWHDRAVFHFLVDPAGRERYLAVLRAALAPGGWLVLAVFGPAGPTRCSGLPVERYSAEAVSDLLGPGFRLVATDLEDHVTPGGQAQQFMYGLWRREARTE